ncbi:MULTISPECIES: arginine--tRNA ligase [Aestuariibaculum]|uniref:Arginine--tRNA ligase n=1 Tax=Aestuariibaculum lutulentum TaxID=2920935 RepID=A0ABS9REX0_9FLAO|nr:MULTISPECIES: arginine--tRNA ligase [Aestuariibaculum]MCH4551485.1 arginine--tRNA ligase [Aestuariibaculum lutulentum]MCR8666584.1 arginine--tRNA ligase [Aestuariibaculum sp. M13]
MSLQQTLQNQVKQAVLASFDVSIDTVEFQATRKEFAGDITVVIFPMLRYVKGNPVQIGETIGNYLVDNVEEVKAFNVVKGFLNVEISDAYYMNFFNGIKNATDYGFVTPSPEDKAIMVEYSSPNTNKPLHLGHIRNNLLGYSVSEILKASGKKVYKTQIINDRGIHICKSMLAWEKFGNGETPETTGLKGDKLVGNYYVKFDQEYKKEIETLVAEGKSQEEAKKEAPLLLEAQNMLRKWESGDEKTVALWKTMNGWVYDGFAETYTNMGVDFDTLYYESNTYLLGKEFVAEGLKSGVFFKEEDGSVWCDLTEEGLDKKIVQRADGTAVYMTQDIGTAIQRIKDFPDVGGMVYTVGNEQDYHFQVLFIILKKLGFEWAKNLYHLSYGMVDLPSGKMKSREGTVVDADDLIDEMATTAEEISEELGKLDGYTEEEKKALYKTIGLGALKYYILKVDPKKRILFDPKESIDFQGNTGPFIQYTYARIQAILRRADFDYSKNLTVSEITLHEKEKELLKQLELFPEVIQNAATQHSPALIANYTYDLVKEFNSFYQNVSILGADNDDEKIFRVQLSKQVANTIKNAFSVLGIQVPERM